MIKSHRNDLLLTRTVLVYSVFILFFCAFSGSVFARQPLPLIPVANQDNTASSSQLKTTDAIALLMYVKKLQVQAQIITKDYFYISQGLREDKAREEIKESALAIDKILAILSSSIKNEEVHNLLDYLNEINLESKAIFNDTYSNENAVLIIDFSETIDEGAQSIINYLTKNMENSHTIHDDIVQQQLVLQRINKFYIAYQAGFNDATMFSKLAESVNDFQQGIDAFSAHKFADDEQQFASVRLKNYWSISKKFYEGMEKGELTLIVFVSTDHMMSYLDKMLNLEK